eukprot:c22899_g1_i1 orf=327-1289(+)
MMAFTKEKLLAYLQEICVDMETFDHPAVMTVEEQSKYIGHLDGGLSKNLFLKDKKNRLYLVSALATTAIDFKVLSQRLGLGKGGLRMVPEEMMQEVLKVPLGCVTPFALINESARSVSLLLDQGLKTKSRVFFHPVSNDATTSLTVAGLDTFLRSIGREPEYVDLEAVVAVGKDHPPDLAAYVPGEKPPLTGQNGDQIPKTAEQIQIVSRDSIPIVKASTTSKGFQPLAPNKATGKDVAAMKMVVDNPQSLVAHILSETVAAILAEVTPAAVEQHGKDVGLAAAGRIRERLAPEFQSIIMMFKNTAYTQGFVSGVSSSRP